MNLECQGQSTVGPIVASKSQYPCTGGYLLLYSISKIQFSG